MVHELMLVPAFVVGFVCGGIALRSMSKRGSGRCDPKGASSDDAVASIDRNVRRATGFSSSASEAPAQSNFVPASHVFVAQDLSSRDEVLRFISSKAVELGSATDEEELFQAFLRREAEGTTGMMEGFAIPHAKSSTVQEASAYVVKLAHGADDWETMDTASVTVVIGLLIPESKAGTEHLKLLSKIAEALMDDDFRAEIRATDDAEAIARATNARLV